MNFIMGCDIKRIVVHCLFYRQTVPFAETAYSINAGANYEYHSDTLRLSYSSLVTPRQVIDYNMNTGVAAVRKEQEVPGYKRKHYECIRMEVCIVCVVLHSCWEICVCMLVFCVPLLKSCVYVLFLSLFVVFSCLFLPCSAILCVLLMLPTHISQNILSHTVQTCINT